MPPSGGIFFIFIFYKLMVKLCGKTRGRYKVLLKKMVSSIGAVLAVSAGIVHADVNSQLANLQAQINQLQAQINASSGSSMGNVVGTNAALSWKMMSNYGGVGKEMNILNARQHGLTTLTVGGQIQADALYDHNNQSGANTFNFANPAINGANPRGANATRLAVTNTSLATTASMGNWITGYVQVGKANLGNQYLSNTTGPINTPVAVQDAYLVFGNLSKMPTYGFVGYKDIDFGNFATVDMYHQPLNRTLFQAQGNAIGIGYNAYGFNGVLSLLNGGNHNAVTSVNGAVQQENLNSSNNNNMANFAANASYGATSGMMTWILGVGYLNGSQFVSFNNKTDGAWDVNAKLSAKGFDVLAEYDSTSNKTNITAANEKRAQAWDLGADYNFLVCNYKTVISADYSQAYLGQGSVHQGYQYVLGYRIEPLNNVWTGLEYSYSKNITAYANNAAPALGIVNPINGDSVKNNTVTLDVTAMF